MLRPHERTRDNRVNSHSDFILKAITPQVEFRSLLAPKTQQGNGQEIANCCDSINDLAHTDGVFVFA